MLSPNAAAQSSSVRQIPIVRTNPFPPGVPINASAGVGPELDSAVIGNDPDSGSLSDASGPGIALNRSIATAPGNPMPHPGSKKAGSHPELVLSIDALNHYEQRFVAAGGINSHWNRPIKAFAAEMVLCSKPSTMSFRSLTLRAILWPAPPR